MRDAYGLVPSQIREKYEREEMVDRQIKAATALCTALKALDSRLDVVFITEGADPEYGVTPGRWHVVRKNDPPAPDSYIAITTESGGYREPDSGVLHEMQRRDLWRTGVPEHVGKRRPESKRDDSHIEELAHDIRAGNRLAGDGGYTRKLWGKK